MELEETVEVAVASRMVSSDPNAPNELVLRLNDLPAFGLNQKNVSKMVEVQIDYACRILLDPETSTHLSR